MPRVLDPHGNGAPAPDRTRRDNRADARIVAAG